MGVDRRVSDWTHEHLKQVVLDLADKNTLEALWMRKVDRCIHLAALAHAGGGETDFSFERFKFLNVTCAENVFEACVAIMCLCCLSVLGCHWHGEGVNKFRHRAESYLELWKRARQWLKAGLKRFAQSGIYRFSLSIPPSVILRSAII